MKKIKVRKFNSVCVEAKAWLEMVMSSTAIVCNLSVTTWWQYITALCEY